MKGTPYIPKSKSQIHITPDTVYDIIEDNFGYTKLDMYDPCPIDIYPKQSVYKNGLYGDWKDINYCNPPYEIKTLTKFVKKAVEQTKIGNETILLVPVKTDQEWFHDIILENGYDIVYVRGRLKFVGHEHHSPQPHMLILVE